MPIRATPVPGPLLLSPTDHALIMIDFQSQMAFATKSIAPELLRNNAALVSNAAAGFKVPTILTTVAEKSFSGPMFDEITTAFDNQPMLDTASAVCNRDRCAASIFRESCVSLSSRAQRRCVKRSSKKFSPGFGSLMPPFEKCSSRSAISRSRRAPKLRPTARWSPKLKQVEKFLRSVS